MKTKPLKLKVSHNYKNRINTVSKRKEKGKLRKKCAIVLIRLIKHLSWGFLERLVLGFFSAQVATLHPKNTFVVLSGISTISHESQMLLRFFFLLQLTSLLKMGGDRIMRHSIRGSGSIHKGCSSLAETPNIKSLGMALKYCIMLYYVHINQAMWAWFQNLRCGDILI